MENKQELETRPENDPQEIKQPEQSEWVEPTFERLTLKDAMSGPTFTVGFDYTFGYS